MSSKSERTRNKILEAALRLLTERGFYGVGMEEVARAAGISRQALYLHFASKSDLLVAVAEHADAVIGIPDIVRSVGEAKTAQEVIDHAVTAYAAIEPQIYEVASTVHAARRSDEAAEAAWQDRMGHRLGNARRIAEALRQEGLLADGWTVDEAADF
ncbi:MAG: helix-turn-helix domain-containing protein, partial [Dehalococcoidia bacterium]